MFLYISSTWNCISFYFIYLTLYLESCDLALNVNPPLSHLVLYLLIRDMERSLTKLKMTQMVLFPVDVSLFVNMTFFISSSGKYNFVYIFFIENFCSSSGASRIAEATS